MRLLDSNVEGFNNDIRERWFLNNNIYMELIKKPLESLIGEYYLTFNFNELHVTQQKIPTNAKSIQGY